MIGRWIIRGICIAQLMLCGAAWVGSYCVEAIAFHTTLGHRWTLLSDSGVVILICDKWTSLTPTYIGLDHGPSHDNPNWYHTKAEVEHHMLIGFHWGRNFYLETTWLCVPLWFPTILSAGLLWLVWRKTRPKYTGKGFPVETAPQAP
jgi:hypothetical protein